MSDAALTLLIWLLCVGAVWALSCLLVVIAYNRIRYDERDDGPENSGPWEIHHA
ncbi:hypothetical protein [Rhizobium sp. CSW-27]|uniref:hypothetical protein n=1 Tax=Rhizobium sp. CSW-27 TaxID=2839985 RepID=UPI001C02CFA8|nr:hypothetical protein [Rhizobium sp. CSW-27]MBT9370307.1 hypothetical protein [Rhizobium sp. CSW-27]